MIDQSGASARTASQNKEAIRLDEEPVLKTGGCRNVACEFESHGFRCFNLQGRSPGSGLGLQSRRTTFESLRPCFATSRQVAGKQVSR